MQRACEPVVTTKVAGFIVRDSIDGALVRERDPEALHLAGAIEAIVEGRTVWDRLRPIEPGACRELYAEPLRRSCSGVGASLVDFSSR